MSIRFRLALILLVTAAHRAVLAWATYTVHPDAGTAGIMALDILEGERPLFMYGFHYSGSLLTYLIALSFRCFGVSIASQVLPTVLFAVGWVGVSYLLFRDVFNRRAGLAAALIVAVPDWVTARYSMIPDCSYSPLFFLVTLTLWLCYRIAMRELPPAAYWIHTLALGLSAGLALWTHPIAGPYLICGMGILLPFFIRHRFHPRTLAPFLAGGVLFATCLVPYVLTGDDAGAGTITTWIPRTEVISLNYNQLVLTLLPRIFHWPGDVPVGLHALAELAVCAGGVLWFLRILTGTGRNDRIWATLPLLFCGIYLTLSLPHRMAVTGSMRYTLPLWTMLAWGMTAVCIASNRGWIRAPGTVLLGAWVVYNTVGMTLYCVQERSPTADLRANHRRAVDQAAALDLTQVITVGDYYNGMESQALTMFAENRIRFTYAGDERHLKNAQAADAATQPAYAAFNMEDVASLTQSLDALGATYRVDEGPWMQLVYQVALPTGARRALLPSQMLVHLYHAQLGTGEDLLDRSQSTYISGAPQGRTALLLDLGTQRPISGLAIIPKDLIFPHLPTSYRLEGSEDGRTFTLIREVDATLPVYYSAGDMVYVGGEYGRIECNFPPERVRFLRVTGIRSNHPHMPWRMSELYVFEHQGDRPASQAAPLLDPLADATFTATDRWLSAHLLSERPASAWPRHNTHLQRSGVPSSPARRNLLPRPTTCVAVNQALGDDLESIFRATYGESFRWKRTDVESYALFQFEAAPEPEARPLQWNGLTFVN